MIASRTKHAAAWIALLAVLYAAATPLLAALRDQPRPDYFGALCTMGGVKDAPGQPGAPAGGGTLHQPQCVFCISGSWHAGRTTHARGLTSWSSWGSSRRWVRLEAGR